MTWYRFFQMLATPFVHAVARVEVLGRENVPREGPFILVANHQGILDPLVVQALCPRPLHTLTKSTQFSGKIMRWILPRVNAIPTRRYRIDPQVVRTALRVLSRGGAVGVYPEGERSWDGALQPFRRGTMRVILKAGVPVIPCGVAGTYDVWPRWSRTLRRQRVRVEFGEALAWPAMDRREERERALGEATLRLREALEGLSRWERLQEGLGASPGREGTVHHGEPEWLPPRRPPW